MRPEGDLWSAWCATCQRFVAEETSEEQARIRWETHWIDTHRSPVELVS